MKKYLFLDNFRGFTNTSVPLADVNFLVGENSTGKTSLLTLMRLLSSPKFFMGPEFGGDDIQLGHFNELVSAHSRDRSYFRVGSSEERPVGNKNSSRVTGMLCTYREEAGLSKMSRLSLAIDDRETHMKFEENGAVLCKTAIVPLSKTVEEMNRNIPRWIREHTTSTDGWRELDLPQGFRDRGRLQLPLFAMLSFAAQTDQVKESPLGYFPPLGSPIVWIAPIRTKPRRTYDEPSTTFSSDGSHTPYVIRRMLSSKDEADKFSKFMNGVGKASGLFQRIETNCFGNNSDSTAPFEVDAVLDDRALNLNWVGYGVSQALPILVELLDRPEGSWFAIQQPEVHLHPRAQASLGDVFFEMAIRDNKRFLIETHSDFTIDRFRMNYRRRQQRKRNVPESQILFFERRDRRNVVTPLPIGPRGDLPAEQPNGYRDFFIKEDMRLLGL